MPALLTSRPITWPAMKNEPTVVIAHATSEMIRARRSASRCSITDMRCSSTGAAGRRARERPCLEGPREAQTLGEVASDCEPVEPELSDEAGCAGGGGRAWRRVPGVERVSS